MGKARLAACVGVAAVLMSACGRFSPSASPADSASPTASESPTPTPAAVTITVPALHVGEVGIAYPAATFTASGGSAPYVWRISEGALPGGLTISPDGVISGTPAASGTFNFTAEVTDSAMLSADAAATLNIQRKLAVSLVHANPLLGRLGEVASGPFAVVSGGVSPYTITFQSGTPPTGTQVKGLELTGAYTTLGTYNFAIGVTDSAGAAAKVAPRFIVYGRISFPPWNCDGVPASACPNSTYPYPAAFDQMLIYYQDAWCVGDNSTGCTAALPYTGGTPGHTPTVGSALRGLPPYPDHPGPLLGMTAEVYGGAVHITVPPGAIPDGAIPGGFYGVILVWLWDDPNCGPPGHEVTDFCTTRNAFIRVKIAA